MGDDRATRILAVLLGASTFPNAPKLAAGRAFYLSADEVQGYLSDVGGMALPHRNILSLFDDSRSPSDQLVEVASFLARRTLELKTEGVRAEDLLIYYVGHGLFTRGDQAYCFAVRSTNEINEGASSIRAGDLAGVIKENAAFLRRYLILDCCFAASIHKEFQSGALSAARVQIANDFPERGTALLCASNAREPSLAPKGLNQTMFSSALIQALRQGHEGAGPQLSFSELGELIKENLRHEYPDTWVRPEVHSPDQREGDIAHIPLFPNPAYREHKSPEEKHREAEERRNRAEAERAETAKKAEQERLARKQEQERLANERADAERAEATRRAEQERVRERVEKDTLARKQPAAQQADGTKTFPFQKISEPVQPDKTEKQAAPGTTLQKFGPAALLVALVGGVAWSIWSGPQLQPSSLSDTTQQLPAPQTGNDASSNRPSSSQTTNAQTAPKASDAPDGTLLRFGIGGLADAQTVFDSKTGLMWTRKDYWGVEGKYVNDWNVAMKWADKLNARNYAGFSDWKVPTVAQYRTINSSKADREVYAQTFDQTDAQDFWTSNTPSQYIASYIGFSLKDGGWATSGRKTGDDGVKSVRLVRYAR